MSIEYLYYFINLTETLNYSKSAELLHVSQSNLSYAISTMESELGVKLFSKVGRHIELTDNGNLFLNTANQIIFNWEAGLDRIKNASDIISEIAISCARVLQVSPLIEAFFSRPEYGNIKYYIKHRHTARVFAEIKRGEADFGIVSYPPEDSLLEHVPVYQQNIIALFPSDNPLSICSQVTAAEIAKYPIIIANPLDGMYDRIIEAFKNLGLSNTLKVIDTDSSNAAAYFATQGKGVALVIDSPPMQLFPLERRPIIDPEFRFFLYLVYRKTNWKNQIHREFIKALTLQT